MPELDGAAEREDAHRSDDRAPYEVGRHHHAPFLHAVAYHSADQQEHKVWNGHCHTHERQRDGRIREFVDLPREGDQEDPVPQERNRHANPQQTEVAPPQRREHAQAAHVNDRWWLAPGMEAPGA